MTLTTLVLTVPFVVLLVASTLQSSYSEHRQIETYALEGSKNLDEAFDQNLTTLTATLKSIAISFRYDRDLAGFAAEARRAVGDLQGDLILLNAHGLDLLSPLPGRTFAPEPARVSPFDKFIAREGDREVVTISDLLPDLPGFGRRFALSILVAGPDDETLRLAFAIRPAQLGSVLLTEGLGPPYLEAVVDRVGTIVAASGGGEHLVGRTVRGFSAMTGDAGQMDATGIDGTPLRRFYRRCGDTGWYVLVSVPTSSLQAPFVRSVWLVVGVTFLLLFVVVPVATVLTRRMRNATRIATESARWLARGGIIDVRPTGVAETDLIQQVLADASGRLTQHAEDLKIANRDLEARVAARSRELAVSHALTNSILANSPDTIEVLDEHGRFVFTNNKGYREHRVVELASGSAAEWPNLWSDGSAVPAREALAQAQAGRSSRFTGHILDVDEKPQWYDVLVTPMIGACGSVERILVVSRDITASHLRDQELVVAKNRAEAASKSKAEFLASMSHELRTPLNGILGYADLLSSDGGLPPQQRIRTHRIQEAALGLLNIVNDVLDLAKIEAGEMALRPHPMLLREDIDTAVSIVMPLTQAKEIALLTDLPPDLPPCIEADAERLRQILLNLLSNAVKFTDAGTVCLSVRAKPATLNQPEQLAFAVRDTGIGIPADLQPLLFRRFSQLDTSDERRFGGTGLGLAICRHLVEQMNGTIEVESEPGRGSTFRFTVPLIRSTMVDRGYSVDGNVARVAADVLVVEDNALNRALIEELLIAIGCTVDVVGSGQEAVDAVQRRRYDLVVMDDQMPGMSGTTATRAIRSLDHPSRDVVIIGCSANVFAHQISRFEEAGMNGFVAKPLTRAALANVFARHLPKALVGLDVEDRVEDPELSIIDWLTDAQLEGALVELRQELEALRSEDPEQDAVATAQRAHRMISSAFVLQQSDLAACCTAFEDAHAAGAELREPFARMVKAIDAAILHVDRLFAKSASRSEEARHHAVEQEVW